MVRLHIISLFSMSTSKYIKKVYSVEKNQMDIFSHLFMRVKHNRLVVHGRKVIQYFKQDHSSLKRKIMINWLTSVTSILNASAIAPYNSLTLVKPDIVAVGLPCACWQWNMSFGLVCAISSAWNEWPLSESGLVGDPTIEGVAVFILLLVTGEFWVFPLVGICFDLWSIDFWGSFFFFPKSGMIADYLRQCKIWWFSIFRWLFKWKMCHDTCCESVTCQIFWERKWHI